MPQEVPVGLHRQKCHLLTLKVPLDARQGDMGRRSGVLSHSFGFAYGVLLTLLNSVLPFVSKLLVYSSSLTKDLSSREREKKWERDQRKKVERKRGRKGKKKKE